MSQAFKAFNVSSIEFKGKPIASPKARQASAFAILCVPGYTFLCCSAGARGHELARVYRLYHAVHHTGSYLAHSAQNFVLAQHQELKGGSRHHHG